MGADRPIIAYRRADPRLPIRGPTYRVKQDRNESPCQYLTVYTGAADPQGAAPDHT